MTLACQLLLTILTKLAALMTSVEGQNRIIFLLVNIEVEGIDNICSSQNTSSVHWYHYCDCHENNHITSSFNLVHTKKYSSVNPIHTKYIV